MITINNLDFINNFSKISVNKICKQQNIDRGNLSKGKTTDENINKVKEEIEKEIHKLYYNDRLKEKLLEQKENLLNKSDNVSRQVLNIIKDILEACNE